MSRGKLVAVFAGVVLIEFLSLRACFRAVRPAEGEAQVLKIDDSIVAMTDGSVMIAKPGTIGRDVVDWFNNKSAGPRQFDFGRQPFVPNSDLPAPEAAVRLARFVTEMKANPDVSARIIVCSSTRSFADQSLASGRAHRLQEELASKLIDPGRISTEPCRTGAAPGNTTSEQNRQTISIALAHGG